MELKGIGRVLLDEGCSPRAAADVLDRYGRICAEVTGITPDAGFDAWDEDRFLDGGIAINPRAAAHCVRDYRRTQVFLRAVAAALDRLLAASERGAVRVLYAGCGPWATLLLPVLERFPAERLQLELLDAHRSALDAVRRLLDHFGLGAYAIGLVEADASTYRCRRPVDLVVTETMHKALEQEPQFAVTANLAPQLAPGGVLVPERIDVELALSRGGEHEVVGRVMTLSADAYRVPAPVQLCLPGHVDDDATQAELITTIRAFEAHRLRPGEANITLPRPCPELSGLVAGSSVRVEFRAGRFPVFELTPLVADAARPH